MSRFSRRSSRLSRGAAKKISRETTCASAATRLISKSLGHLHFTKTAPSSAARRVSRTPFLDNYRVKVDGEHAWVFDAGSAWYVCRNDPNLTVVNYVIKSDVEEFTGLTNVLRVEQLVDGSMVLIDIISANGVVQTITRKYDEYRRIIGEILIPPSVIIRKEYSTFEEAEKARLTDGLPSDGVIIIEKNTSITYRIKKPTIDLLCYRGDMQILLQGRRRMHVCAGLPSEHGIRDTSN
ncbi:unnamed protein product [Peronospora belbahrii]|uniref:Uncharacterized protein n=1 Tax=Peronospora belbahrii TaxID=622444 RepID=A0ABN8DB94_9STRA|nr:unnamed protein product [Peronospora belbahrii]